jgi:pimeloyl-ACP methyl ester carboxylesterase
MVGRALGPNILDAMRAARAIAPVELPAEGPAGILGYSEGGAAAAWAAQLQPTYAPDMPLFAVAAGAAAADLETATPALDGSFFSFFVAYGGIGYAAAYPELELEPYLTEKGRKMIPALRDSTVLQAMVSGPKFAQANEMTDPPVLELPEWRARLRENRLGSIKPTAPVLLYHAKRDQIVRFEQSVNLREDWKALGADVRLYVTRGGVDHISAAFTGTPVAIDWLARRLASRRGTRLAAPAYSGALVPVERLAA